MNYLLQHEADKNFAAWTKLSGRLLLKAKNDVLHQPVEEEAPSFFEQLPTLLNNQQQWGTA
jgi:hypothetical protein